MKIAFYGKGGIGKSTIAANVSAMAAASGKKVLHIGCDPKADSTRTLVSERIPTVLEMLEEKGASLQEKDIVFQGKNGVFCLEAGGPQAGVGCAGLGISAAVKELERLEILKKPWDLIVYDVLGDVVCGGFSVPMRQHYVDKVYIVTSADYMSLYAANNILKGAVRYSKAGQCLAGGILFNHMKNEEDLQIIRLFSTYTGLPVKALLQESIEMRRADYQNLLFTELFPKSSNTVEIRNLCSMLEEMEMRQKRGTSLESKNIEQELFQDTLSQEKSIKGLSQEEMEQFRSEIFQKGWIG